MQLNSVPKVSFSSQSGFETPPAVLTEVGVGLPNPYFRTAIFSDLLFANCVALGIGESGGEFVEIDTVRKRFTVGIVAVVVKFVERDGCVERVNGEDEATGYRVDFQTDLVGTFGEVVGEVGAASWDEGVRKVGDVFDFKFACDGRGARRVRCVTVCVLCL